MKILLVHNFYGSTAPSGENRVFEAEKVMLERHGEIVETYTRHSDEIRLGNRNEEIGIRGKIRKLHGLVRGAFSTVINPFSARQLVKKIKSFKPDVVHFHNTFPLISPLAVWVAHRSGAKVVATLHNYRLWCAAGVPMRDGKVCTTCVEKHCICEGVKHRCYRGSLVATLPLALNIALWRFLGVWSKCVDRFICLTPFQKEMVIKAGLPAEKLVVKGNFLTDEGTSDWRHKKDCVVYAGRLSPEKGPQTLVEAWNLMGEEAPELFIIGDGDFRKEYEGAAKSQRIHFLGQMKRDAVLDKVREAKLVVIPSLCYEGLPTNLMEAFMLGTPCLVSDLGALPSLVKDGETGGVFKAGNAADLAAQVKSLFAGGKLEQMGQAARKTYEANYTEEQNYQKAQAIYTSLAV